MNLAFLTLLFAALALVAMTASAHPGGTDASGGHTCKSNCTEKWHLQYGEYHKHNAGGGYTNSAGQTYDKSGTAVSGSSSSSSSTTTTTTKPSPTPSPTPTPVKPSPAIQQTAPTPSPTPTSAGDVLGTTEEVTPTPEESPEPTPTPTPSPTPTTEPTKRPTPTPTPEPDKDSSAGTRATLSALALLTGGGYYLYHRSKQTKTT